MSRVQGEVGGLTEYADDFIVQHGHLRYMLTLSGESESASFTSKR